jgi:hypothetical protein
MFIWLRGYFTRGFIFILILNPILLRYTGIVIHYVSYLFVFYLFYCNISKNDIITHIK